MKRRLAKKIQDHPWRYSRGRWIVAMKRLGWVLSEICGVSYAVKVDPGGQKQIGIGVDLGNGWTRTTVGTK